MRSMDAAGIPGTVVGHSDLDVAVGLPCGDDDAAVVRRVLRRVVEQVADDLLDVGRLAGDDRQVGLEIRLDRDRRQLASLLRDDPLEETARLDRLRLDLEPATLDATQDEQVLDEPVEALGLGSDVLEQRHPRRLVVGSTRAGQDLGESHDRRDRCPQLMADDVDEGLPERPGAALLVEQPVAILEDPVGGR